ncbi:type 1 glutamine amidotransferase domain-containing protein [Roseibacillus persicicus]|uniref:type 1 glutamine amidotransferase domain-containing protein n=1 Tax=Roseibacillus persicicus TaxID=454148 RepID=UPI00398AFA5E
MNKKHDLIGKKIAILATDGFEESELLVPKNAVEDAGAEVTVVSLEKGSITAASKDGEGASVKVDKLVNDVTSANFNGLILPGGLQNPDTLRTHANAIDFVRSFFRDGKPVAAICHAPWLLAEAGVLDGRTVTSYPSIRTDLENAGAKWVDQEVHCDEALVTSRSPDDLDAFCSKAIEEFAEGIHEEQTV